MKMSSIKYIAFIFSAVLIARVCFCEVVEIDDGIIRGTEMTTRQGESFHAFLSIPFAAPPLKELRFKAPQPVEKWEGILNTTELSPMCIQSEALSKLPVSEDCLYLNVYTKSLPNLTNEKLKPVAVFIHGGALQLGSASDHEPHLLMERDVVFVTMNYRLGAFGFLSLGTEEIPGNAGLKDQVFALRWVQRNIAKFGGDPSLITIMGNSAGAYSVSALMVSPMAQGLFHRVIALSGSVTYQRSLESNYLDLAKQLAAKLNCSVNDNDGMVACLREVRKDSSAEKSSKFYLQG